MIDWRSDGVSNGRSTRKLDRRLSGTRTGVRVAELRQATDRFALVDEEIIEVVYEQAREVQFASDNGVVDTIQDEADEKNLFQNRKFAQSGLREGLTLQSSLSAKAAVGAAMLCLRKQGQPSPGLV